MSNEFQETASLESPKRNWAKPVVRRIRAGSAEFGRDLSVDDADGDQAAKDS